MKNVIYIALGIMLVLIACGPSKQQEPERKAKALEEDDKLLQEKLETKKRVFQEQATADSIRKVREREARLTGCGDSIPEEFRKPPKHGK